MEFRLLKYCLLSAIISRASVIAMESKTDINTAVIEPATVIEQETNMLFHDIGIKGNQITNQMEDNTLTTQEELNTKFDFLNSIAISNNTCNNDEIDFFKKSVLPNISLENFGYVLTQLYYRRKIKIDINTFSGITALLYYYLHKNDKNYNKKEARDVYYKYYPSCDLYKELLLAFINKYFNTDGDRNFTLREIEKNNDSCYYATLYKNARYLQEICSDKRTVMYDHQDGHEIPGLSLKSEEAALSKIQDEIYNLEAAIDNDIGYNDDFCKIRNFLSGYNDEKDNYPKFVEDYKKVVPFIQNINLVNVLNKCILLYNELFVQKTINKETINSFIEGKTMSDNFENILIYKAEKLRGALCQSDIEKFKEICPQSLYHVFKLFNKILHNSSEWYSYYYKKETVLNIFKKVMHKFLGENYSDFEVLYNNYENDPFSAAYDDRKIFIYSDRKDNDIEQDANIEVNAKNFNIKSNQVDKNDNIEDSLLQILITNLFKDYSNTRKLVEESNCIYTGIITDLKELKNSVQKYLKSNNSNNNNDEIQYSFNSIMYKANYALNNNLKSVDNVFTLPHVLSPERKINEMENLLTEKINSLEKKKKEIIASTFGYKSYNELLNKLAEITKDYNEIDLKTSYNIAISIAKEIVPVFRLFILSTLELSKLAIYQKVPQYMQKMDDAKKELVKHTIEYNKFYGDHYTVYSNIYKIINLIDGPNRELNQDDIKYFKKNILRKCESTDPLSDVLKTIFIKNNRPSRIEPDRFASIDLIMQYIRNLEYNIECNPEEYNAYHISSWVDSKLSDQLLLPFINFFFENIQNGTDIINKLENIDVNNVTENTMKEYLTQINYNKYKNNMSKIMETEFDPNAKKAQEQLSNELQLKNFKGMIQTLKQIQLGKSLKQFVLFVNEIHRDFYKKK